MTTSTVRYPMSFNARIIDKPEPKSVNFATHWINAEVTSDEMIELVMSGRAFAPQYKRGYRAKVNFERVSFLAADFDNTMRLEDALKHDFIQEYASFIYTTSSHTESQPIASDPSSFVKRSTTRKSGLTRNLGWLIALEATVP